MVKHALTCWSFKTNKARNAKKKTLPWFRFTLLLYFAITKPSQKVLKKTILDRIISCQLYLFFRLDFVNFVLAQPGALDNGCDRDQFLVTAGSKVPIICGTNTGQHSNYFCPISFMFDYCCIFRPANSAGLVYRRVLRSN